MSNPVDIRDLPEFVREAGVRHGHVLIDEGRVYMGAEARPDTIIGVTRSYRWAGGGPTQLIVAEWEREVSD